MMSGFSGYIHGSSNILFAELYAIYTGLLIAKDLNFIGLICYSDSLHCVNLIQGPSMKFHVYAVLIQEIKELITQIVVEVTQNWISGSTKSGPELAKSGSNLAVFFSILLRLFSALKGCKSAPEFAQWEKSETYFWARFVTILWGLLLL